MKRLFLLLVFLAAGAHAQFQPGRVLTAADLNAALAAPNITGGTLTGSVVDTLTCKAGLCHLTGSFTAGGLGTFTRIDTSQQLKLERTNSATGAGFLGADSTYSLRLYSNDGVTAPFAVTQDAQAGRFLINSTGTTYSGQLTSTQTTGTAPLVVSSTTRVANLNVATAGTADSATTVTTNANLTGPITSTGNATAVASQTGTGSTFVMSASPVISGSLSTLSSGSGNAVQIAPSTSGSKFLNLGGTPGDNASGIIQFLASNSTTNWKCGTNITVGGAFQCIPSTAGGGSTFTTSVFDLSTTGLAITGALSATAGLAVDVSTSSATGLAATGTRNTTNFGLATRNTNNGTSAVNRTAMGNDASANALTMDLYSSTNSTKPNNVEITNQTGGTLALGGNGSQQLTLGGPVAAAVTGSESVSTTLLVGGGTLNVSPAAGLQYTGSSGKFMVRTNGQEAYLVGTAVGYIGCNDASSLCNLVGGGQPIVSLGANHFYTVGSPVPSVANNDCGSSTQGTITAGGNDNSFKVTVGTAAVTSCAITFGTAWTTAPNSCTFTPANTTAAAAGTVAAYVSSITTTKVTIGGTALASAAFYVQCM